MGDTPGFSSVSPKKNRSKVVKFTENMCNELKRMTNNFSEFFPTQKIKIAKIRKLIFHLFQLIAHIFYKFDHL